LNRLLGLLAEFGRVYANSARAALWGARAALQAALRTTASRRTRLAAWIIAIYARIGYHKTLVAIANKHARLVWTLLMKDEPLRDGITQHGRIQSCSLHHRHRLIACISGEVHTAWLGSAARLGLC